jgi:hypothetical protein
MTLLVRCIASLCLLYALASCVAPQPSALPPLARMQATPMGGKGDGAGKSYVFPRDWSADGWTLKKGAAITFSPDGTGVMEATVYDTLATGKAERLHCFIHVAGTDGNELFVLPNTDAGHVLHVHGVRKDCIHTVPFAYDARYFASIQRVTLSVGRAVHAGAPGAIGGK